MAKSTSNALPKEESENLYDFDDIPSTENSGAGRIEKPGIIANLLISFKIAEGKTKAKDDKPAGEWKGFEVTLVDPETKLELSEVYFAPPTDPLEVKYPQKKYELVEERMVNTREATPQETIKILNNEFIAYLIDIAEALGYAHKDILEHLVRNSKGGFDTVTKAFMDKFKSEGKRVTVKILYNNNVKKETSFLKIHGSYPVYYPYGNDLFDQYFSGKPTVLKLSKWESENGLVKKFTGQSDAPKNGQSVNKIERTSSTASADIDASDDLPF